MDSGIPKAKSLLHGAAPCSRERRLGRRAFGLWMATVASLSSAQLQSAESPPLRLGSDVWPPFTDAEGKPREALDLVESALLRTGRKAQFSIAAWSDVLARLEKGELDGSAAMWKTSEREKQLLFSEPYLENRLVLVARKGSDVSAKSLAELAGQRLALVRGYGYGEAVAKPNLQIVLRDSDAECLRAVLAKQADYLLLDQLMVDHLFRFYTAKANELISTGTTPLVTHPLHFVLRRDYPGAQAIIAGFNRSVAKMQADGTYNVLLHVPWLERRNAQGKIEYVASSKLPDTSHAPPSAAHGSYEIATPARRPAGKGAPSPTYTIDGRSYDNWGDAATTLERSNSGAEKGAYQYSTGFVLGSF